ncbi:MAG TPA: phage portal protein [Acidimicrobiales bacterium]|nr:phage portal protein [Acidimicrobiales bacterium]
MSLLRRAQEARAASLPESLMLTMGRGGPLLNVSPEQALRLQAVWQAVNLIADLISTLPVDSVRQQADGTRSPLSPEPGIVSAPSADVDPINWRRQVLVSWLLRGNACGDVVAMDRTGWPTQIELLHPDAVGPPRRDSEGIWRWSINGRPATKWPLGKLWHVPAYTVPGSPWGLSPISYAATTIGLGIHARDFGGKWFDADAVPSAVLESDQKIDGIQAKVIKGRFKAAAANREVVAMGLGLKYKQIQVAPEESQFLQTINATAAQIAGFFGLRPEDVNASTPSGSITYQNVEQQQLGRLVYPMGPWMARLDAALTALLPRPQYVRVDADALVRADLVARYKAHDIAIRSGMASPDERRHLEDQPPIPDGAGGVYLWPPYAIAESNTATGGTP